MPDKLDENGAGDGGDVVVRINTNSSLKRQFLGFSQSWYHLFRQIFWHKSIDKEHTWKMFSTQGDTRWKDYNCR